jgi:voltage-gated potassium channel
VYLEIIEYVCITVFIADYFLRWATADLSLKHGKLSFLIYPFTPMAIIDALSIMPGFISLNESFKTLRLLRLLRALRAFKLIRHSKSIHLLFGAFIRQRNQLLVVLAIACLYVFLCALILFNVEPDTFNTIFDALYWSVVSLTTVGYGDLYPTSEIGRAIAMISSFMGVAVIALPSSIITAGLLEEIHGKESDE